MIEKYKILNRSNDQSDSSLTSLRRLCLGSRFFLFSYKETSLDLSCLFVAKVRTFKFSFEYPLWIILSNGQHTARAVTVLRISSANSSVVNRDVQV